LTFNRLARDVGVGKQQQRPRRRRRTVIASQTLSVIRPPGRRRVEIDDVERRGLTPIVGAGHGEEVVRRRTPMRKSRDAAGFQLTDRLRAGCGHFEDERGIVRVMAVGDP
jgi:hypothetical protein